MALAIGLAEQAGVPREWPGLGRRTPPPFRLVLVEDSLRLGALTGGRVSGWGAGVTLPARRLIALRADLPELDRTLRHELGHLVLRSVIRSRVPLWFDEGYAVLAAENYRGTDLLELNLAVALGRIPSLDQLDGWLRHPPPSAALAYALAGSAVAELARRPPPGGLPFLLERLEEGAGWDAALLAATGLSPDRFQESWRRAIRRRYGLITWLAAGGIWGLLALSLGWAVWVRRERDRPRRVALDTGWLVEGQGASSPGDVGGEAPPPVDQRGSMQ